MNEEMELVDIPSIVMRKGQMDNLMTKTSLYHIILQVRIVKFLSASSTKACAYCNAFEVEAEESKIVLPQHI